MDGPVFYFTRTLPMYRVSVLERLDEALGGRLVVLYGDPPGDSTLADLTAKDGSYRSMKLKNVWWRGETLHWQSFRPAFTTFGRPSAILAEESPRSVSLPILLAYARLMGVPVVLWGHFSSNNRPFSPRNPLDRYRMLLARLSDACVGYTDEIAAMLRRYVRADHVFVAPNTLDTDRLASLSDSLAARGRSAVRRDLGLDEDLPCLLYIGRLTEDKGMPFLRHVISELRGRRPTQWVVIGGGPEKNALEAAASRAGFPKVHFTGPLPDLEQSAPYLFAADVMVLPGPAGLAVNHGFAFGLPVVAQRSPGDIRYHGPEGAYLEHGSNAMLADYSDVDCFVDMIENVLEKRSTFSHRAKQFAAQNLNVQKMVDGLVLAIRSTGIDTTT